jgi:hypothetical protein
MATKVEKTQRRATERPIETKYENRWISRVLNGFFAGDSGLACRLLSIAFPLFQAVQVTRLIPIVRTISVPTLRGTKQP